MTAQVGETATGRVAEQVSWVAAQVEVAAQLGEAAQVGVAVQTWVVAQVRAGQRAHRHARAQLGVLVVHLIHDGLFGAQSTVTRDGPALHASLRPCHRNYHGYLFVRRLPPPKHVTGGNCLIKQVTEGVKEYKGL